MDKSTVIFVGMILIVSGVAIGISSLFWSFLDYEDTYSITYDLDGGINHPDNPDSYQYGDKIELCDPTRVDYIFMGWIDEDGNPILRIDPLMSGDMTIMATWSLNLVGTTITYDVSGSAYVISKGIMFDTVQSSSTMSGTYDMTYLSYNVDRGYEVEHRYVFDYANEDYRDVSDTSISWTNDGEDTGVWTYRKTEVKFEGEYEPCIECHYTEDGEDYSIRETQYLIREWLVCKIESESKMSIDDNTYQRIERSCVVSDIKADNDGRTFDLEVYGDEGISVSGSGTYDIFSSVTLFADVSEGTEFIGWYSEGGRLLSSSKEYRVFAIVGDQKIFAANSDKRDIDLVAGVDDGFTRSYGMADGLWTLVSGDTGDVISTYSGDTFSYEFDEPGIYTLSCFGTIDGSLVGKYLTIFSDGYVNKVYEWKDNGGESHTLSIDILYSDYLAYSETDVVRNSQMYYDYHGNAIYTEDVKFVTYEDEYVVEIAQEFMDRKDENGWNDAKLLDVVLTLTQYIPYQLDEDYMGQNEYWKFPVETLFENGGDCEDTSILFSAIVKAMGYDTALLLFNDHMAASVSYDGQPTGYDVYVGKDGKSYLYCETTAKDYNYTVGRIATDSIPNKYHPENCLAVMVVPTTG